MFSNATCNKYLVAVIDILGAKDLIMGSDQNNSLRDMHFIYDFTLNFQNREDGFDIKIYSDNILIAKPIQDQQDSNIISAAIHNLFVSVCDYQWHLLNLGYLSRGGITIGDFYIDNTIVWGKALVEAHEMEAKKAIFPRVIIDENVLSIYKQPQGRVARIAIDNDGCSFVDYLTYNLDCELTKFPYILNMIRAKAAAIKDDRIRMKYDWYENYHRSVYDNYDVEAWKERWDKIFEDAYETMTNGE